MKSYCLKLWWLICVAALVPLLTPTALATDHNDGTPLSNDFKWMNLNLMYAYKELPRREDEANDGHDYLELEFGGRSGILDLYGYVDVFNLTNRDNSDKKDKPKMFMKFAPRLSLAGLFNNLPWGPVTDIYLATLFNWGGGGGANFDPDSERNIPGEDANSSFWGIGSDLQVPWFGKMGLNLYGFYDLNRKEWNGYQVSTSWFTPFYTFQNGSFISYQGYLDYQFGGKQNKTLYPNSKNPDKDHATSGGAMFNGLYWHYDKFALGYGLKLYSNVYLIKDGGNAFGAKTKASGTSHFFAISYKF
ncbi:outer membrane protein OmpK [Endozoicomonas sp. GU-1]|uniref:nucleoside-specific channel-forming Tsx family protein n=1 Tax=Endozoicomonas sp. GU-1 TaxID=3009078 RepID=UPI0022B45A6A|nr:outer membrane protein OmpK [Endozoicomonas sp. GU-1]WBA81847.1 outer membrane protein OmpK [Endozoicomonas sp. GU-1]